MEEPFTDTDSEFSKEGVLLHSLYMRPREMRPDWLLAEQHEALNLADFYTREFFRKFCIENGIPEDAPFVDEREISMMLRRPTGEEVFPGHADLVRSWPDYDARAIADAKFGFSEVDHATDNLQLASYGVMRYQQAPVGVTGVCIVQPRNFGPRVTSAVYHASAMPAAAAELTRIHDESKTSKVLNAGEVQCHFCKAKAVCPAYNAQLVPLQDQELAVSTLSNDDLVKLKIACGYAAKLNDQVNDEMRLRVEEERLPGWKLQNTGDTVTCTDVMGFYLSLKVYFQDNPEFTAYAFDSCRDIKWGRLESFLQSIMGQSQKKVKEFIKQMAEGFVSRVPKAKSIVPEKDAQKALK